MRKGYSPPALDKERKAFETIARQRGGPPSSCSPAVLLWRTDQNVLFCSACTLNGTVEYLYSYIPKQATATGTTVQQECQCDFSGANCWLGCRCGAAAAERSRKEVA